jgi:hypothetical protein
MAFAGTLPTLGLMLASGVGNFVASPNPTTISGRLTYNGKPLSDSTVVLVPAGQHRTGFVALGEVARDGSFTLSPTAAEGPLEPGQYDLYIALVESLPAVAEQGRSETGDHGPGGQASPATPASPRAGRIPCRFTDPRTSGLSVTINRGPRRIDRIDIDLSE